MPGDDPGLVVAYCQYFVDRFDHAFEGAAMMRIDERVETIEHPITGMDDIGSGVLKTLMSATRPLPTWQLVSQSWKVLGDRPGITAGGVVRLIRQVFTE